MLRMGIVVCALCACGDDAAPTLDAGTDAPSVDAAFDADTTDVGLDGGSSLTWTSVAEPAAGPLMVWGALVTETESGSAVLFGGTTATDVSGTTLDGAWRYDWEGETLVATELAEGPAARYCGCSTYDATRNVVIVGGGRDLNGPFLESPETWELDLDANTWTQWTGTTPDNTLGCMMAQTNDGTLYWFGGASSGGSSNALYRAEGQSWILVSEDGPAPRYDGALWADDDGLLLFAGSESAFGSAFYADVWRWNDGWTQLDDGAGIEGRRVPWHRPTDDGFVFHGGFDSDMNPMDGLYRYVLGVGFEEIVLEDPLEPRGFAAALPAPSGLGVMLSGYDGDAPVREVLWLR